MSADQPYLHELAGIRVANRLYAKWLQYALTITRQDALVMARNGLTHQARALRSMIREATASVADLPGDVYVKLEVLVQAATKSARTSR